MDPSTVFLSLNKAASKIPLTLLGRAHCNIKKRTKFKSDASKTSKSLLHNVATLQSYTFVSFQHEKHFQSLQLH